MTILTVRRSMQVLGALVVALSATGLTACNKTSTTSGAVPANGSNWTATDLQNPDTMTPTQRQALAYAAQGSGASLKDHEAAIGFYRKALNLEPDSRRWQMDVAVELWRAKRTSEAIPIWSKLAKGNDEFAKLSAGFLKKKDIVEASKQ